MSASALVGLSAGGYGAVILGISLAFEGASWLVGMRAFRATKRYRGWWEAFRRSKDPPTFIVVFEDTAAILGIFAAAAGTALAVWTEDSRWDGAASLAIAPLVPGRRVQVFADHFSHQGLEADLVAPAQRLVAKPAAVVADVHEAEAGRRDELTVHAARDG